MSADCISQRCYQFKGKQCGSMPMQREQWRHIAKEGTFSSLLVAGAVGRWYIFDEGTRVLAALDMHWKVKWTLLLGNCLLYCSL